ncbi:unnamed protein product [Mytilus coruscus]|uniref:CCHC-type domain-containing protein n=1 Tax=Mytilus coruscus TaxID=42192 RepID=A0A6J8E539_MYTCO|nr:unnamed protein product [Mytilus coruscus]
MGDAPIIIPTNYGLIDEFDDNSEHWIQYTERLNHYFIANNIESMENQRAILLSACGKKTYRLMSNLSAPQKPGEKTYEDIVKLVTDHQNPKPSSIVQRCKFNCRSRQPNESVSQFVAELRQIAAHCEYKTTLGDMLRDRLVFRIKEDRIRRRLLAEPGLTFKKAMEVATAMETAAKNAQDLQVQEPKPVHTVTVRNKECYRCGGSHNARDCKWKDAKCYVCDKKGHFAKTCRNREKQNAKEKPKFKQSTQHGKGYSKHRLTKTNIVEEDSEDMEHTYTMYQLEGTQRKQKFTIYTDHKPLLELFNETKSILPMALARLQRWALTLSAYANADALSGLPLSCKTERTEMEVRGNGSYTSDVTSNLIVDS